MHISAPFCTTNTVVCVYSENKLLQSNFFIFPLVFSIFLSEREGGCGHSSSFSLPINIFFSLDVLFSSIFPLFVFKSVFYSCCVSCEHAVVDCGRRGEVFLTHRCLFLCITVCYFCMFQRRGCLFWFFSVVIVLSINFDLGTSKPAFL